MSRIPDAVVALPQRTLQSLESLQINTRPPITSSDFPGFAECCDAAVSVYRQGRFCRRAAHIERGGVT